MAQQIFDKHWPLGKNGANELIPGAAILQTRDGKDEPITLAASFQLGEGGLFLPTDKDNPLEVRVRELEKLIGEIAANPTANTVQARLKALADRLGEAVASPNEHTLLARLKAVEEELEAVKDALTSGDAKVTLKGPDGQPISTSNRLPVDVGGQIHADVDLGEVTVEIAEVQQGKRGQNAEPWEVTLTGQIVLEQYTEANRTTGSNSNFSNGFPKDRVYFIEPLGGMVLDFVNLDEDKTAVIETDSKNLFSVIGLSPGHVSSQDGQPAEWRTSAAGLRLYTPYYMPVEAEVEYYRNKPSNVQFYREDFTHILGISDVEAGAFKTPPDTAYIRVSLTSWSDALEYQIEKGDSETSYELRVRYVVPPMTAYTVHVPSGVVTNGLIVPDVSKFIVSRYGPLGSVV